MAVQRLLHTESLSTMTSLKPLCTSQQIVERFSDAGTTCCLHTVRAPLRSRGAY